jgi:hypothetical protein
MSHTPPTSSHTPAELADEFRIAMLADARIDPAYAEQVAIDIGAGCRTYMLSGLFWTDVLFPVGDLWKQAPNPIFKAA